MGRQTLKNRWKLSQACTLKGNAKINKAWDIPTDKGTLGAFESGSWEKSGLFTRPLSTLVDKVWVVER